MIKDHRKWQDSEIEIDTDSDSATEVTTSSAGLVNHVTSLNFTNSSHKIKQLT